MVSGEWSPLRTCSDQCNLRNQHLCHRSASRSMNSPDLSLQGESDADCPEKVRSYLDKLTTVFNTFR